VNALHRQAIHELGKNIRVAGREKNQVIQAIEHVFFPFMLGVQWHPEYLPHHNFHQRIFKALICASHRWRRSSQYYLKQS
jgi:putative glutamine amidotransferase